MQDAAFGLKEVMAMRPVTFKWKGRNEHDFGLIAEEVAKIDPLFVTYKDGRVEGVKYAPLTAVLVNAVKQLEAENVSLKSELTLLRKEQILEARMVETQIKGLQQQRRQKFAQK